MYKLFFCGKRDNNRNLHRIDYNDLNLPRQISYGGGDTGKVISYVYATDGTRLKALYATGTNNILSPIGALSSDANSDIVYSDSVAYCGNSIYANDKLDKILIPGGYITVKYRMVKKQWRPLYYYHYIIRDHQGSARVCIAEEFLDSRPIEGSRNALGYYPFGKAMNSWSMWVSPFRKPYTYTGKEEETMHGLGWYDYGKRFYDPNYRLSFISIDPLCEKYYSISPYAYCANNPVNAVDLRGDSITTVVTTVENGVATNTTYYYGQDADGNYGFFDSKGNMYSGDDQFVKDLTAALGQLGGESIGKALVDELMKSEKTVQIVGQRGKRGNSADPEGKYVKWNSTSLEGGINQKKSTQRPAYIGLGHELAHIQDVWNGTYDESDWTKVGLEVIPNAEKYAVHVENQLRAEHGLPLRTHYVAGKKSTRVLHPKTNRSLFFRTKVSLGGTTVPTTPYSY